MKITKRLIDTIKAPIDKEQLFIRDTLLTGFGLRVTKAGIRSFVVEKRVNGKPKRITIGRYPQITPEQARNEAHKILGKMALGVNPVEEKKSQKTQLITLGQVFADYLKARKSLKATTRLDYQRVLKQVVPDWLNKPILSINKDMIVKRHAKYGTERSEARANLAMRLLRAIFNFAAEEYEDYKGNSILSENPVRRLSHTRSWYRVERRQSVIKAHELKAWYEGLIRLSSCPGYVNASMMQDYFLLILFTGLRRHEAASLKCCDVDLTNKTFTLHDTKNRSTHTLPMSDFLYELFLRRKQYTTNDYVFPANSQPGHLVEPRKALVKVIELSGITHTIHDLRRTFITLAESLDIPVYALKRLLNHKMTGDVTAGYIVADVERLRRPMQLISDYLLKSIGVKAATIKELNILQKNATVA